MRKLYPNERIVDERIEKGVDCWIVRAEMEDAPVAIDTCIPKSELIVEDFKIEDYKASKSSVKSFGEQSKEKSNVIHCEDAPVDVEITDELQK